MDKENHVIMIPHGYFVFSGKLNLKPSRTITDFREHQGWENYNKNIDLDFQ